MSPGTTPLSISSRHLRAMATTSAWGESRRRQHRVGGVILESTPLVGCDVGVPGEGGYSHERAQCPPPSQLIVKERA